MNTLQKRTVLSSAITAILMGLTTTAYAQENQEQDTDGKSSGIEEIRVTAQKRSEPISKTPVSMNAITGDELESAGVTDALSLERIAPSAQISQDNGLRVTIRGVSSPDGTEKGDPSAAFMLNGFYMARPQAIGGSFFDVERIEVLRGPQGTLYGRNATAGVVNVISNKPNLSYNEAKINTELASYGTVKANGMVNYVVSDDVAVRAAISSNQHDSYLYTTEGVSDRGLGNDQDELAARLSTLWEFGDDSQGSLYLVADYTKQEGQAAMALPYTAFFEGNIYAGESVKYFDTGSKKRRTIDYPFAANAYQDKEIYGITGELNYDFGELGLTYLTGYRVYNDDTRSTLVRPRANAYNPMQSFTENNSYSHELRLATTDVEDWDAVVGLYYFKEESNPSDTVIEEFQTPTGYLGYLYPEVTSESKAIFTQATYHVNDKLSITGGARYSVDNKSRKGLTVIGSDSDSVGPDNWNVAGVNDADVEFSKSTWKLGVDYDVSKNIMAFANISTGYKAGGFNDGCTAGSEGCANPVSEERLFYKPEELTSYEAGVKGFFLDRSLSLNVSAFYYDYTNMQLNSQAPNIPGQVTSNAGESSITGAEIEAKYVPTSEDKFDLALALLDTKYDRYKPLPDVDFAGKSLDYTPSAVLTAGYTRSFFLDSGAEIQLHADTRYSASYVATDFTMATQLEQPSFWRSNASLTYFEPNADWHAQLFVKNIENEIVFSGYRGGRVFASEPRIAGVRFSYTFY